ncbi:Coupling of ubiquitin conjugation to ER degradation protein 1 [Cytospora mali]|uniref:Coupling of ubiquitin conjugation to ER degradation protein 1 n=1 Tax=Cytospora mali TaxID=578113 RepID=A0A194V9S8_CYTMA|nr:Coupling of ubiquitin conjugation to ER degradation protein 1 [Valsa mali var. pyri (nom. inval.)]
MANDQINLPSLVVILVLSGLIVRYLFFSTPSGNQQPRDSLSQMRQREAAVERIQQMFPQVDRRTILWDLQRNGGSIAATTEKILSGRMETPPITFQPPPPPGSNGASSSAATSRSGKPAEKPTQPNLIQRYKLEDKVKEQSELSPEEAAAKKWSSNKEERQSLLQKRRDEMILAARRKMEAKIAAEKAATSGST